MEKFSIVFAQLSEGTGFCTILIDIFITWMIVSSIVLWHLFVVPKFPWNKK